MKKNPISEFFESDEGIPDTIETNHDPAVETSEEYGYIEPSIDVPAPDVNLDEQNLGFTEGESA